MTAAVARASAVLVVPASRTAPAAADGTGLEIAVNRGGHLERIARSRLPRATIVTVDDNRSLPTVLASGDVDGVVTDTLELRSFALHGGPTPRVALVLSEDRKAYWVAPRESALAADLDAWLAQREADGSLARLRVQELGGTGEHTTDAAELAVVDLVARRLLLMPEVAEVKRVAGRPVDAPARAAEVYARAREEATRVGLAPEPYAAFVRAQVEAAKVVQRAVLAQPSSATAGSAGATATEAAARARARLDSQIRPAIDRIDGALRAALVAAVPLRMPVESLAAALRRDASVPGFDAPESAALAAALARIPAAVRLP
jgi:cyclohexadienyl dehydratase